MVPHFLLLLCDLITTYPYNLTYTYSAGTISEDEDLYNFPLFIIVPELKDIDTEIEFKIDGVLVPWGRRDETTFVIKCNLYTDTDTIINLSYGSE